MTVSTARYLAPDWFTRTVFNPFVAWLTRRGISVAGSRVLEVRGRTTGALRTVPVNLLTVDGVEHLVAPRGETQWVRNLRHAGEGRLRVGRRTTSFTAVEVADADKPVLLRRYLEQWAWEVGRFFDDIDKTSTDEQLLAAAPAFPVFVVTTR
jgi:deazaflavin-dependent oxidoreductase (nitroreductase family)